MVQLKRTSQGGFLQTFIIIAILLAVATIGVAYFVKNRGETARRNDAIALADQIESSEKSDSSDEDSNNAEVVEPTVERATDEGASTESKASEAENLPTTGPAEDAVIFVIELGILSAMIMYYIDSRRKLSRSL